jgi:hypothetical protein
MYSAGARALRGDDNEMSREAVLLQWERKIEAAERRDEAGRREEAERRDQEERRDEGRFVRSQAPEATAEPAGQPVPLRAAEDFHSGPRFERTAAAQPVAARRTITINGQPTPARRRRPVVDAQLAQPDRIALWAFLLGLLLVAVAAGTAHA